MYWCLGEAENRRHACVGAGEDVLPLGSRAGGERRREALAEYRPAVAVVLCGQASIGEPEAGQQGSVELRLQRADRHVFTVGCDVGVVERRAAVEQVDASLVLP